MSAASGPVSLNGEFILLRPLRVEDARLTFEWRQAKRASLLNQGAQTLGEQARWIAGRPSGEFNFVIETRQGHPVGMISLVGIDRINRVGEPGRFLIGDEQAAQGLPAAAEAMRLVYDLAFDRLELRRVWGIIAAENRRMIKWQTFMGMTREGCLRQHLSIRGQLHDAVVFGLLAEEYRRITHPRLSALIAAARLPLSRNLPTEQAWPPATP